jgi:hypothetical protein
MSDNFIIINIEKIKFQIYNYNIEDDIKIREENLK